MKNPVILDNFLQKKIDALIDKYDPLSHFRKSGPGSKTAKNRHRLPFPGSCITKTYKGKRIEVKVLEKGFEYQGRIYSHLSHIAKEVTGAHWNGYLFFNLK